MSNNMMNVYLSHQQADARWGENPLTSTTADGISIHLTKNDSLGAIQRAGRKIDGLGIKNVTLAGEGWGLEQSWSFWQGFTGPKGTRHIEWATLSAEDKKELEHRLTIIDWVRDTINCPADKLSPEALATNAIDLIRSIAGDAVSYTMTRGEALREQGYTGIYGVGQCSNRPSVLLTLDYNPTNDKNAPVFACLVGKGITFDTGGYNIKPGATMGAMKSDMGGAATVAGALALAVSRGLDKRVKMYLCCADNMISGEGMKMGDIFEYRNGKTVEIMNTDAEGRLVLADGLIDADKQNAQLIIDCATLTGAAKTAVGNDYHSALSFDDGLVAQLMQSANEEDELFWRLPLAEFHRSQLPSNFAELNNIAGAGHTAGASTAAAFLSHFVNDYKNNWLHLDLSATYRNGAVAQWAPGATGLGVRTLANLLLSKAK